MVLLQDLVPLQDPEKRPHPLSHPRHLLHQHRHPPNRTLSQYS